MTIIAARGEVLPVTGSQFVNEVTADGLACTMQDA